MDIRKKTQNTHDTNHRPIQVEGHMKFRKKHNESGDSSVLLRRQNKINTGRRERYGYGR